MTSSEADIVKHSLSEDRNVAGNGFHSLSEVQRVQRGAGPVAFVSHIHVLHSLPCTAAQGREVVQFEDHTLLRPNSHISNVYINHAQDTIVSLCQVRSAFLNS